MIGRILATDAIPNKYVGFCTPVIMDTDTACRYDSKHRPMAISLRPFACVQPKRPVDWQDNPEIRTSFARSYLRSRCYSNH